MFIVKQLVDGEWIDASSHTQEVDAQSQKQRFIENGTAEETLKIEDSSITEEPA